MESEPIERGSARPTGIDLAFELSGSFALPAGRFTQAIDEHGLRELRYEGRSVGPGALEAIGGLGEMQMVSRRERRASLMTRLGEAFALLDLREGWAHIEVAGRDRGHVDEITEMILERLPKPANEALAVPVSFWAAGHHSVQREHRRLEAHVWEQVAAGYSGATAIGLSSLAEAREPGDGNLILWHGEPGTGKTSALRALAYEWRHWCAVHFIIDPEHFLGRDTSAYMLEVLAAGDLETPIRERKLIVLEDSGELLTADAQQRTGQALSRLLNLTDGLPGQGMNASVLITTNEPLGKLHPAVQRPGRCWSELEFAPLSQREANEWLTLAGSNERVDRPRTLADLYAIKAGRLERANEVPRIGFV